MSRTPIENIESMIYQLNTLKCAHHDRLDEYGQRLAEMAEEVASMVDYLEDTEFE